ncbi:hypothetical protein BX600DRAFT_385793, partial [Xylariales sp. PMI_506]
PPTCFLCNKPSVRMITRKSNRKGNAERPYYKCHPCDKFLCFADKRGNDPTNPVCHCGASSRRQIAGRETRNPGGVHFVCRLGTCDFYAPLRNGCEPVTVQADDLVKLLAALQIV